jgi:hypothetical protein
MGNSVFRRQGYWVNNHAAFKTLNRRHFRRLLLYAHIFMKHADAIGAFGRQGANWQDVGHLKGPQENLLDVSQEQLSELREIKKKVGYAP